jgi:predicted nucleic acid-binding protein
LKAFFDTNVLVYAVGEDDDMAALAIARLRDGGVVSVQVLNEMVAVLRGKLKQSWEVVQSALEGVDALRLEVVSITPEAQRAAVEIASRHDIHIYDATIVACALEAGCDTLWTEDLTDGQRFGGLTVRNPFVAA